MRLGFHEGLGQLNESPGGYQTTKLCTKLLQASITDAIGKYLHEPVFTNEILQQKGKMLFDSRHSTLVDH